MKIDNYLVQRFTGISWEKVAVTSGHESSQKAYQQDLNDRHRSHLEQSPEPHFPLLLLLLLLEELSLLIYQDCVCILLLLFFFFLSRQVRLEEGSVLGCPSYGSFSQMGRKIQVRNSTR